jgi:hypothetical protein
MAIAIAIEAAMDTSEKTRFPIATEARVRMTKLVEVWDLVENVTGASRASTLARRVFNRIQTPMSKIAWLLEHRSIAHVRQGPVERP